MSKNKLLIGISCLISIFLHILIFFFLADFGDKLLFVGKESQYVSVAGRMNLRMQKVSVSTTEKSMNAPKRVLIPKETSKNTVKNETKKIVEENLGVRSELAKYLTSVRALVEEKKYYPLVARKMKIQGIVEISVVILPSGKLKNIRLEKSSSFDLLDQATLDLFNQIKEVPAFPKDIEEKELEITIPIAYQLE